MVEYGGVWEPAYTFEHYAVTVLKIGRVGYSATRWSG
jgi:hypothetical protein